MDMKLSTVIVKSLESVGDQSYLTHRTPWTADTTLLCPWDFPKQEERILGGQPFSRDLCDPGLNRFPAYRQILHPLVFTGMLSYEKLLRNIHRMCHFKVKL